MNQIDFPAVFLLKNIKLEFMESIHISIYLFRNKFQRTKIDLFDLQIFHNQCSLSSCCCSLVYFPICYVLLV